MVVSQPKTSHHISKKNDNLTITTKNLKTTMDNKKKKRKNSIKSLDIKENLNKQTIKDKEKKSLDKIKVKESYGAGREDNLDAFKEEGNEEQQNENNLAEAIDFDEDFWCCSHEEKETTKSSIVNNEKDNKNLSIVNGESKNIENGQEVKLQNLENGEVSEVLTNGFVIEEKCCDFCSEESENLAITLQIYCKDHNGRETSEKSSNVNGKKVEEGSFLKASGSKENSEEFANDTIVNDRTNNELDPIIVNEHLNEEEEEEEQILNASNPANLNATLENGDLNCSSNCVCFCNEGGAPQVLSIVENGFLINHNNHDNPAEEEQENEEDFEDDLDDSDLPNYSRSCVYEERIIDFENFRIIEQVIDNNCEGKHSAANNTKCRILKESERNKEDTKTLNESEKEEDLNTETIAQLELPSGSKTAQKSSTTTPIYINPSLNFSCSELVAFIGESYQVIDNAQAVYNNDKVNKTKKFTQFKTKESSSVGNSPFKRGKRAGFITNNVATNRVVDDNNNTRRYTGVTAAERLMQSLNCDVARELQQTRRIEKREVKVKTKPLANAKTPTPTKTLLKALKSKLTPLAPPFQPAAIKNKELQVACNANSSSGTLLNYEQTTIYYHQQQQQQQQQLLNNNMLHALSLVTPNQQQQLLMQQQPQQQVSPSQQQLFLAQQQHQHQQHLQLQTPTQPNNILQHHQQHCAQNILALAGQGMPHIHLPTAAATTSNNTNNNNGNLSSPAATAAATVINVAATNPNLQQQHHHQHHLLPIQLISAVNAGHSGTLTSSWPLLEATNSSATAPTTAALYMDINGELRSICPAHGAPPTAVTLTTPLAPLTNQLSTNSSSQSSTAAAATNAALMQQQNTICLNSAQYPLTITAAQYHNAVAAIPQQQQHAQLQQHLQPSHHHSHHHLSSLANAQTSSLRLKTSTTSNSNSSLTTASSSATSTSSSSAAAAASNSASSSSVPPRVVLQLDAGVSLPLQIAGKRKIFRGECTFYYNSYDNNKYLE